MVRGTLGWAVKRWILPDTGKTKRQAAASVAKEIQPRLAFHSQGHYTGIGTFKELEDTKGKTNATATHIHHRTRHRICSSLDHCFYCARAEEVLGDGWLSSLPHLPWLGSAVTGKPRRFGCVSLLTDAWQTRKSPKSDSQSWRGSWMNVLTSLKFLKLRSPHETIDDLPIMLESLQNRVRGSGDLQGNTATGFCPEKIICLDWNERNHGLCPIIWIQEVLGCARRRR